MSSLPKHELMLWVGVFVCLVHLPNRLFAARINEDNKPRLAVINSSSAGRFLPGFVSSLSLTLVSELGDKTFFIAAILAMKNSRVTVFFGCMSALISMTVLSVGLGFAANAVPTVYTHYISIG
ncbi:transmembrane protein-like [Tropilaelaps mercedesae]|uniref:GDT1 family protein n=1 Tax=Tropilaelaps mercedesae TaxID=418985 RepID=A0A1V9XHE6_9ACAR|nr:transmembrane protein-like [Tropilaelaps mercedesae]